MISIRSRVRVTGAAGPEIIGFMLACSDETYQQWWPGTHLAFHTTQRFAHLISTNHSLPAAAIEQG